MSLRYPVQDPENVEISEDGGELEILFNTDYNGNNYVDIPIEIIMSRVEHLVIQKIMEIRDEYIRRYGCVSCWSDDHNCTCAHDKARIKEVYSNLIYELQK